MTTERHVFRGDYPLQNGQPFPGLGLHFTITLEVIDGSSAKLTLEDKDVPVISVVRYRDGGTTYVYTKQGVLFIPSRLTTRVFDNEADAVWTEGDKRYPLTYVDRSPLPGRQWPAEIERLARLIHASRVAQGRTPHGFNQWEDCSHEYQRDLINDLRVIEQANRQADLVREINAESSAQSSSDGRGLFQTLSAKGEHLQGYDPTKWPKR